MDLDEMLEELNRVREKIKDLDPTSEAYSTGVKNLHENQKMLHEELEARDSELDHELKRELDKAKLELSQVEERNRMNQGKWDAILGVVKIGLTVCGTIAAIIVTGSLEESTILSQKCYGLVRGLMPRV